MDKEYQPYGEEWRNELIKLPKIQIIAMYRMVCLELKELEYSIDLPSKHSDK